MIGYYSVQGLSSILVLPRYSQFSLLFFILCVVVTSPDQGNESGLSGGAVAGIVIGVLFGVAALAVILLISLKKAPNVLG